MAESANTTIPNGEVANTGVISAAERSRMIAEAAYYRAQNRGFDNGDSVDDWIAAEREIDARLLSPPEAPAATDKTAADKTTALVTRPPAAGPRGSRARR